MVPQPAFVAGTSEFEGSAVGVQLGVGSGQCSPAHRLAGARSAAWVSTVPFARPGSVRLAWLASRSSRGCFGGLGAPWSLRSPCRKVHGLGWSKAPALRQRLRCGFRAVVEVSEKCKAKRGAGA